MASFRRGIELAEARSVSDADTAQAPDGTRDAPAPQAWQPPAPLEPLPVRGVTAPAEPSHPAPDPLETNTLKE